MSMGKEAELVLIHPLRSTFFSFFSISRVSFRYSTSPAAQCSRAQLQQ